MAALTTGQAWAADCTAEEQAATPVASAPAAEPVGAEVVEPVGAEVVEVVEPVADPGATEADTAGPATAGPATAESGAAGTGTTGTGAAESAAAVRPSDSDLFVVRMDPDAAAPGGTTTVHAFISNLGPDTTASPFTVVVTLPAGVTAEGPYFPDNCYAFQEGHRVRCTFPAGLQPYRSATALVPVRLAATVPAPGTLTGGWVAVRSSDDCNEENNKQPFEIAVVETTEPRPAV
ncbi:hypothetical protein [Kitasatospora sp. NPDC008115]|uniref:hypothetical protein n=1 Tax=Kitasatospora sp. NPDC008115 TaxID=3364022 RepID=UPI0036EC3D6E